MSSAAAGAAPNTPVPLRRRVAHGFFWTITQFFGSKVIAIVSQVVLAWLLNRKDYGLVALAYTVSSLVGVLYKLGVREVLIYRQKRLDLWAGAGVSLSLSLGLVGGLLMVAAAPVAAKMYDEPQLFGLVLILASAAPLESAGMVPEAYLRAQLRFQVLAVPGLVLYLLQTSLTVLLAWLGFGAYSFLLPMPLTSFLKSSIYWLAARPQISLRPRFRRWKYLLPDGLMLLGAGVFHAMLGLGDYMVLGLLHTAEIVGLYFFAFSLSMQTITLLSQNLAAVLFPSLSKLRDDPQRQLAAFLRAARVLTLVGAPLCFLQAAAADPAIRLFFNPRWYAAIPAVQILSIGTALRIVGIPASNLIQAQGRFRMVLLVAAASTPIFFLFVIAGALVGEATSVALAVALCFSIIETIHLYIAIRPAGGTWRNVWSIDAAPLAVAALATGVGALAAAAVPDIPARNLVRLAIVICLTALIYVPIIRLWMPDSTADLLEAVHSLRRRQPSPEPSPA